MDKAQILEAAIQRANKNSGNEFGYTMGELLEDITVLQEFAKAIWNAPMMWELDLSQPCFETKDGLSEWQYHLQQMVISEDPIKYLADNLA